MIFETVKNEFRPSERRRFASLVEEKSFSASRRRDRCEATAGLSNQRASRVCSQRSGMLCDGNDGSGFDGNWLGLIGDQPAQKWDQHDQSNTDREAPCSKLR